MKKNICILLVILLLICGFGAQIAYGQNDTTSKKSISIWYQSLSNHNEINIVVPSDTKDVHSYALTSLFNRVDIAYDQWSEIPSGTKLNSLTIDDGLATIDLSSEFIDNLTCNHNVNMILDSIKNTVFQFNDVTAFRIKVNGSELKQLNDYNIGTFYRNNDRSHTLTIPDENSNIPNVILGPIDPVPTPVIYIDAGHGGTQSGAVNGQYYEKDINLALALKVRDYLVNNKGATVIMSRTDDSTKEMNTRIAECNNNPNINFIVTIHCNSSTNTNARGTQSFYPSTHDISNSSYLAQCTHNQLLNIFPQFGSPTTHDGIGLLYYTNKPAVLIETGFISNSSDLQLLLNNQTSIAAQIYYGIRKYWWGY